MPFLLGSLSIFIFLIINLCEHSQNFISTLASLLNIRHQSSTVLFSHGSNLDSSKAELVFSLPLSPDPSPLRLANHQLHSPGSQLSAPWGFLDTISKGRSRSPSATSHQVLSKTCRGHSQSPRSSPGPAYLLSPHTWMDGSRDFLNGSLSSFPPDT